MFISSSKPHVQILDASWHSFQIALSSCCCLTHGNQSCNHSTNWALLAALISLIFKLCNVDPIPRSNFHREGPPAEGYCIFIEFMGIVQLLNFETLKVHLCNVWFLGDTSHEFNIMIFQRDQTGLERSACCTWAPVILWVSSPSPSFCFFYFFSFIFFFPPKRFSKRSRTKKYISPIM